MRRDGLDWLLDQLLAAGSASRVRLEGLKDDRRAVIGGGLSVLRAVFDLLEIDEMQAAQGALRHGVLYDLLDREQGNTDVRSTTVQRLALKFDVDAAQAQRVGKGPPGCCASCAAATPTPTASVPSASCCGPPSCTRSAA